MSNTSRHLSLHVIICLCRLSFIFFLLATMLVFCLPAVLSVSCCNSTILTLSNLFKNNNKAYLGSAQLLVRDSGSTYLGSKVRGYCWEERGQKKIICHLSPRCPYTTTWFIEDQGSTWVLAETSHIPTTADIACLTCCLQPIDLPPCVPPAAFEKITKKSICAQEELGGARCCAGLLALTFAVFNFQDACSQDFAHICWVSPVNI